MQLNEITIHQLGVIDAVRLAPAEGLTVITGETGAGKTMLVTALQLALGARADQGLVREGAEKATIDVVFTDASHVEGSDDDGVIIITREIPADGRASARLNQRPVSVGMLEEMFGRHVEVHAQHTHVRLSRREVQRDLLDRYAGEKHEEKLSLYQDAFNQYQHCTNAYETAVSSATERARERDRLAFELEEIDQVAIDLAHDDNIDEAIARLAHVDELFAAAHDAAVLLDADHGAQALGEALQRLRGVRDVDAELGAMFDTLDGLRDQVVELSRALRGYTETLDTDPAAMSSLQERKHQLAALTRKYGPTLDDVLTYANGARDALTQLDTENHELLRQQKDDAQAKVQALAADVHAGRTRAAKALQENVQGHLSDLGMPYATFHVAVTPDEPQRHGADEVAFLLAPNPGERPTAIADAVSGGERSRVALALEVALADVDDADILVFDEVDAGIGGETAFAVGEKLARLARGSEGRPRQVMCVTHLAQLAVFADRHYVVQKKVRDGRTHTNVEAVADDSREAELSRLLGGVVAHEGIEHARLLITTAKQRVTAKK